MGDFPDFNDPDIHGGDDPFGSGGVDGAIGTAGDAAIKSIRTVPSEGIPADSLDALPDAITTSLDVNIKNVPTTADGNLGKMLQANILEDPGVTQDLAKNALSDAIETKGSPAAVTPSDVQASVDAEVKKQIAKSTQDFKTSFKDITTKALSGPEDLKGATTAAGTPGGDLVDKMVDDPAGAEADLNADASDIEAKNPDWKEKVKAKLADGGKALLEYGAKGLLILAVCGALIPGTQGPIDKLASMAGDALKKILIVAANIIQAFLGPFITSIENFLKKMKGPLIVIGIIILIVLIGYIYKTFLKKSA